MNGETKVNRARNNIIGTMLIVVVLAILGCDNTEKESVNTSDNLAVGAVATGHYANLFVAAGYSAADVKNRIDSAFQLLFFGDPDTQAIYYPSGGNDNGPLAYIYDVNSKDVRSEGMSYGMMIAVQLNKKEVFDSIWNWSLTYMYNRGETHPAKGFFAWSVKTSGEIIDEMPAPDGEEYFATALYFAAERWGNGEGIYNYSHYADTILHDIRHREVITGMTMRGEMTGGNLFDEDAKMVRFTPDIANADHTDASYHLPSFYEVWSRVGPKEDRDFWKKAAQVSRDYFVKAAHSETGLTPDYGNFDGTPWAAPWRAESEDFRYDAWRTAMNWSMDWSWWAADPRQQELSNRLQRFFESQGLEDYQSLYSLEGKMLGGGQTTGIVAMNATAGMAANEARKHDFIRALWELSVPTGPYRYYDGMLYMMAFLHCGGEYKAWLPTP
ncbi:glycosyl hydrolase family 8 [Teredinibacter haidensis]|uniref:glycosyl hydrolase family 8 n=1 Tax=Teredinibacter haidensis TaxID=2731755 RepID=UPI000948F56D|nr:glycosyl hydrolase family 8 [Teredinibacter haidensis]